MGCFGETIDRLIDAARLTAVESKALHATCETHRMDIVVIMTDEERAAPSYEDDALTAWRQTALPGRRWFDEHAVTFTRHYTGSLACVPSRPTLFTGHYLDFYGVI